MATVTLRRPTIVPTGATIPGGGFARVSSTGMGFVGYARMALVGVSLTSGVLALTGFGTIPGIALATAGALAQGALTLIDTGVAYARKGAGSAAKTFAKGAALVGISFLPFGLFLEKLGLLGKGAQAASATVDGVSSLALTAPNSVTTIGHIADAGSKVGAAMVLQPADDAAAAAPALQTAEAASARKSWVADEMARRAAGTNVIEH